MLLISRCDVHTTMLCATAEEEEKDSSFIPGGRVYCMCTSCSFSDQQ